MDEDIASLLLRVLALVCPLLLAWWLLGVDARPGRQHTPPGPMTVRHSSKVHP